MGPLLLVTLAFADCAVPRTVSELQARVATAEGAWTESPTAFQEAERGVAELLDCVNAPVPAPTAARLLRLRGLSAFGRRQMDESAAAFSAARGLDPALTLDEGYAGEGHPLRAVWDTAIPAGAARPLRAPLRGRLYVNGEPAAAAPSRHPFVLQWVDGVQARAAVSTAGDLPAYPRAPHPARTPLLATAGTAALASGVLFGLAWTEHERAAAAPDAATFDEAEALNHSLVYASAGAGGVAVLALAGAFVVARF